MSASDMIKGIDEELNDELWTGDNLVVRRQLLVRVRAVVLRYHWLKQCTAGEWEDLQDERLRGRLDEAIDRRMT